MSVNSTTRKQSFTLDAINDAFDFTFPALVGAEGDIKVVSSTLGTDTMLVYATDYTVEINTDGDGGTVTLDDPSAVGYGTLTVYRETTNLQESDYEDYNQFPADTLERDLDRRTMIDQEQAEVIGRSVKVAITSDITALELPSAAPGKGILWNAAGDGLQNSAIDIDDYETELAAATAEASGYANDADVSATASEASATAAASSATTAASEATGSLGAYTQAASHATTAGSHATTAGEEATASASSGTVSASHATTSTEQVALATSEATTAIAYSATAGSHATTSLAGATASASSATTASSHASTAATQATLGVGYANDSYNFSIVSKTASTAAQSIGTAMQTALDTLDGRVNTHESQFTDGDLSSGVLNIAHSLNSNYVSVLIYDNSAKLVVPDEVTITDANNVAVNLTSFGAIAGTWKIFIIGTTTFVSPAVKAKIEDADQDTYVSVEPSADLDEIVGVVRGIEAFRVRSTGAITMTGSLTVMGDLFSVPWTDYSAVSTITGWSSFSVKLIYTKKIGNLVFVSVNLEGTSDANTISFTLPYANNSGVTFGFARGFAVDNGSTLTTGGRISFPTGSSTVTANKDYGTGTWTTSNGKSIRVAFFYLVA